MREYKSSYYSFQNKQNGKYWLVLYVLMILGKTEMNKIRCLNLYLLLARNSTLLFKVYKPTLKESER